MYFASLNDEISFQNKLLAVYFNKRATDKFIVGVCNVHNPDFLLLSLFAPDSHFDGFALCMQKAIYRIEHDSQYLSCFAQAKIRQLDSFCNMNSFDALYSDLEKESTIVQLFNCRGQSLLHGIPLHHSEKTIEIQQVFVDGHFGDIRKIRKDTVGTLIWDSQTEKEIYSKMEGYEHDSL